MTGDVNDWGWPMDERGEPLAEPFIVDGYDLSSCWMRSITPKGAVRGLRAAGVSPEQWEHDRVNPIRPPFFGVPPRSRYTFTPTGLGECYVTRKGDDE